jgi:hypothetical protein
MSSVPATYNTTSHNGLELRPRGTLPFRKPKNFLALTAVNHQLQMETRLLPLSLNDVVGFESHLHAFLDVLPKAQDRAIEVIRMAVV